MPFLLPAQTARGKAGFSAAVTPSAPDQIQAKSLALADARVQAHVAGHRAEVLAVLPVGAQLTSDSLACMFSSCLLVEVYDFDANATVSAVVDLNANIVRDVLYQPNIHPGPNQHLIDLAIEIARKSPAFARELGRVPAAGELAPMPSGVPGTPCADGHICLAATVLQGKSLVWAVVDVTAASMVAVLRTPVSPGSGRVAPAAPAGCPAGATVTRGGWSLSYETTPTDGFRVYGASYLGIPVLNSAKIVEWHVDYGAVGFVDEMGCAGLFILPNGATQVNDILSGPTVIGFDLVQDFRMGSWGSPCNYRYEQHDQFYNDGRFRIIGAAYGQGCSSSGIYRPIMRLDMGLASGDHNSFDIWEGAGWQPQTVEGWWSQAAPYSPQGYLWRLTDQGGQAYFIEPGQGQFGDGGRGDFAFMYATQHHPAEGDTDMGVIGTCCNSDYHQGPDLFVDDESIAAQHIVLWYVPQLQTDATPGQYYCWTVHGDPNPETYPCPAGPMFVPQPLAAGFVDNAPQAPGATVVFTSTSGGLGALNDHWDFGDGLGTSSAAHPAYSYTLAGLYTVTLTITDTTGTQNAARVIAIGDPPSAGFNYSLSKSVSDTVIFTNTTIGSLPLTFNWDFGDTLTSTAPSVSHTYALPGVYTAVLTATNFITSNTITSKVFVPPVHYNLPLIAK